MILFNVIGEINLNQELSSIRFKSSNKENIYHKNKYIILYLSKYSLVDNTVKKNIYTHISYILTKEYTESFVLNKKKIIIEFDNNSIYFYPLENELNITSFEKQGFKINKYIDFYEKDKSKSQYLKILENKMNIHLKDEILPDILLYDIYKVLFKHVFINI